MSSRAHWLLDSLRFDFASLHRKINVQMPHSPVSVSSVAITFVIDVCTRDCNENG